MSSAIVVDRVVKSFPASYGVWSWLRRGGRVARKTVLDGVSLEIERGELFGLLGPNGAGKSTLLNLLATIALPDAGTIVIDGVATREAPLEARRRIALCGGSERSFYYRLTVRQNLEFFGALVDLRGATLRRRIDEVLELVDLGEAAKEGYAALSTGMRQRLSVARALLAEPAILLFDEPTRAVDPVHAAAIRRLMRERLIEHLGKTVLLATNIVDEAWSCCGRVAMLSRGRIVACDTPANLSRVRSARYTIAVDHVDAALLERTRNVPGVRALQMLDAAVPVFTVEFDEDHPSLTPLLRAVSANGVSVLDIRPDDPPPSEVFSELVSRGDEPLA